MNPEMNNIEYHLSESGPIAMISGSTLQFTVNKSIIISKIFPPANIIISFYNMQILQSIL